LINDLDWTLVGGELLHGRRFDDSPLEIDGPKMANLRAADSHEQFG
jgi:hypothetical protein